jgi:hypothetical protein
MEEVVWAQAFLRVSHHQLGLLLTAPVWGSQSTRLRRWHLSNSLKFWLHHRIVSHLHRHLVCRFSTSLPLCPSRRSRRSTGSNLRSPNLSEIRSSMQPRRLRARCRLKPRRHLCRSVTWSIYRTSISAVNSNPVPTTTAFVPTDGQHKHPSSHSHLSLETCNRVARPRPSTELRLGLSTVA